LISNAGVIPTVAVLQAEGEPALSGVEGDLARITTDIESLIAFSMVLFSFIAAVHK
jgi:hypothetical protein